MTKHRTPTNDGSNNKQQINNNRTTTLERTAAYATGGLNELYLYQIYALDYVVMLNTKHKNCLARTM